MSHSYVIKGVIATGIIYMASIMIAYPIECIAAAKHTLGICVNVIIPTLFPFIFCSNMFIALGAGRMLSRTLSKIMYPLFGVSGQGALAFILGITSGYPVGAVCVASLYQEGECDKSEAEKLLAFCNNSGPMFVIGVIGIQMFNSYKIGVIMYVVHILSAIICGMILGRRKTKVNNYFLYPARDEASIKTAAPDIGEAVVKSVNTILSICGFIIIFGVLTAKIPDFKWRGYIYSMFEITGGLSELISSSKGIYIIPVVAFMTAFSGLSVMAQVYAITESAGLSIKPYIIGKLVQGLIAFGLMCVGVRIIPVEETVFSQILMPQTYFYTSRQLFATAIISVVLSVFAIIILIVLAKLFKVYEK